MSNVIFLAHRNHEMKSDFTEYLCCSNCRNKTFTLIHDSSSEFPKVTCACCGAHCGHMGWVDPENVKS